MFVIKKLRLNKFVARPIVSNRVLAMAMGNKPAVIESKETSDCYDAPSINGSSKTKVLGLAAQIAAKAIEHKETNGESSPLKLSQKDL